MIRKRRNLMLAVAALLLASISWLKLAGAQTFSESTEVVVVAKLGCAS